MDRSQYLESLSNALSFLSEEDRAAALAFYAEMLDDRMEEGMGEGDAVANMESAEQIAARLRAEYGSTREEAPKQTERQKAPESGQSTNKEPTLKTIRASSDAVRAVVVATRDVGVRVVKSASNEVAITYYTDEFIQYDTSLENGEFKLIRRKDDFFAEPSLMRLLTRVTRPRLREMTNIEIEIPENSLIDQEITTSNAGVKLFGVKGLGAAQLTTSNAGVICEASSLLSLTIKTSNARVELSGVNVKGDLTTRSSNGHINAQMVSSGAEMSLTTSNSRITANAARCDGYMTLTTSNASISVENIKASGYKFRTCNSSIGGSMSGEMSDYRIDSRTSNGSNSLPPHQAGDIPLDVTTSNSSIRLSFTGKR